MNAMMSKNLVIEWAGVEAFERVIANKRLWTSFALRDDIRRLR